MRDEGPVILIGPIEPLLRFAIVETLSNAAVLHETVATGAQLVNEARTVGAAAIIDRRDSVAEMDQLPVDLTAVGISTASYDALVARDGVLDHRWNLNATQVAAIVASRHT